MNSEYTTVSIIKVLHYPPINHKFWLDLSVYNYYPHSLHVSLIPGGHRIMKGLPCENSTTELHGARWLVKISVNSAPVTSATLPTLQVVTSTRCQHNAASSLQILQSHTTSVCLFRWTAMKKSTHLSREKNPVSMVVCT